MISEFALIRPCKQILQDGYGSAYQSKNAMVFLIKECLKETSEIAIHICILTVNLWKRLKQFPFALLWLVLYGAHDGDRTDTTAWAGNQWRRLFWKPGVAQ
jgi:hypothetical protein